MTELLHPAAPGFALRRLRPGLGTLVEIMANGATVEVLDAAYASLGAVECALSFYRDDSDIARLNRAAVGASVDLSRHAAVLLRVAMGLERASAGAFNANLGAALIAQGLRPPRYAVEGVGRACAYQALAWQGARRVVVRGRVCLDLGGIAKGYAVDCALAALRRAGATGGAINAGGDLAVFGSAPLGVSVRALTDWRQAAQRIEVLNAAVATSARYVQDGPFHGHNGLAVLDAQGRPLAPEPVSVSVWAPRCTLADALTKVLLVTGRRDHPLLAQCGARVLDWSIGA